MANHNFIGDRHKLIPIMFTKEDDFKITFEKEGISVNGQYSSLIGKNVTLVENHYTSSYTINTSELKCFFCQGDEVIIDLLEEYSRGEKFKITERCSLLLSFNKKPENEAEKITLYLEEAPQYDNNASNICPIKNLKANKNFLDGDFVENESADEEYSDEESSNSEEKSESNLYEEQEDEDLLQEANDLYEENLLWEGYTSDDNKNLNNANDNKNDFQNTNNITKFTGKKNNISNDHPKAYMLRRKRGNEGNN